MKKFALALTALAAFTGSAVAADLPPAPAYSRAPAVVAAAPSWTGFYIFGGAGGGVWDANTGVQQRLRRAACVLCINNKQGGDGWFGTAGAGYDWQFSQRWVFGILGDGQFGSMKGVESRLPGIGCQRKAEGHVGRGCSPRLSGSADGVLLRQCRLHRLGLGRHDLVSQFSGAPAGFHTGSFNTQGWFVGGGVENNLDIFGISAPGWFMKTEYRAAYYDQQEHQHPCRWYERVHGFRCQLQASGSRRSAPRWSIASTGCRSVAKY